MAVINLLADATFIHTESAISLIWAFCNLCLIWADIFAHMQTKICLITMEISLLLYLNTWIDKQ